MARVGTVFTIIVVSIALVILLLSFATTKTDIHLPQDNKTHTGYPAWHPPMPGYYGEKQDSVILISVFLMVIGGYYAYKWTLFDTKANEELLTYLIDENGNKDVALGFDRLLGLYSLVTATTALAYLALDVGKIFSTIGIFHNAIEVVLLVTLHQGGKIRSERFIGWMIFYVVGTMILTICLEWPFDSLWFKMQGLCQDYAILIQFTRIYFATRKGPESELARLIDVERARRDNDTSEGSDGSLGLFQFTPNYTLLLVLGALFHIIGNVYVTFFYYKTHSYLVLSFSYCFTFPIYCYYVYLDTHSVAAPPSIKYVVLPDNRKMKVILVTLSAIFLSFLSARISLVFEKRDN